MYKPVHVLSRKSTRQHRNVFIWCTKPYRLSLGSFIHDQSPRSSSSLYPLAGWRVDKDSPITVSTAYRWINEAVNHFRPYETWEEAETYTLFPVEIQPGHVLTYGVHKKNGPGLSRESQDIITPGDYGVYAIGKNTIVYQYRLGDLSTQKIPHRISPSIKFSHFRIWRKE